MKAGRMKEKHKKVIASMVPCRLPDAVEFTRLRLKRGDDWLHAVCVASRRYGFDVGFVAWGLSEAIKADKAGLRG